MWKPEPKVGGWFKKREAWSELYRQWEYLALLGEEGIRYFHHLMQVNNKITHINQGFDEVKKDIIKMRYKLKQTEPKSYKKAFDTVLKEITDLRCKKEEKFKNEIHNKTENFECSLLMPSCVNRAKVSRIPAFTEDGFRYVGQEEGKTFSWGILHGPDSENYYPYPKFIDKENKDYSYEDNMDVMSSLVFVLNYVLEKSRNGYYSSSSGKMLPKPLCESVKALSSCIKKYDVELSESYLRGYKDGRKAKY